MIGSLFGNAPYPTCGCGCPCSECNSIWAHNFNIAQQNAAAQANALQLAALNYGAQNFIPRSPPPPEWITYWFDNATELEP